MVVRRHRSCRALQARVGGLVFILSVIRSHCRVLKKEVAGFLLSI